MADHSPIKPEDMPAVMPVYDRADVYFERGEGCYLFDEKGDRYLDFGGAFSATALGHAHPALAEALHEQAKKLWLVSNLYKSRILERVAARLTGLTFADTVFFQNSGVEAWELGVKIARKYHAVTGNPERYRIISFQGCFHGRTLAAIAAAKTEKMTKGFGPMTEGFDQVAWDDLQAVETAVTPQTAAIMIEPVQGEGGIRAATTEYLRGLRDICDRHGILLFFDEIQCGMGRTGKLFAHEWAGITPDIMSIAKAIGNGFPVGACLATAKAAQGMTPGTHGSTYGNNPLAMAVVDRVLDFFTAPGFLDDVSKKGRYLESRLDELIARHPKIYAERRGKGLMQGLRCLAPIEKIITAARARKFLIMSSSSDIVRLVPPLIVTEAEMGEAVEVLSKVAEEL